MQAHNPQSAQSPLLAGPMLGEVSAGSARVWVQARDDSPLTLRLFQQGSNDSVLELRVLPERSQWLCTVFVLDGLAPETRYCYRIESRHGETPLYPLRSAIPNDCTTARIVFGSCFHDYWIPEHPLFEAITAEKADVMVMLGDNCYFADSEWPSEEGMMSAHLRNRTHASFQRFGEKTPVLAIYDDHDFGPNDADGNFEGKDRAVACFTRMWAQKRYGTESIPGIFSHVRVGPAEIFLTDGRYHRGVGGHTLLGREQFAWLLDALRCSDAAVKIIACGSSVLAHHPFYHDWESYRRTAPDELAELLHTIERSEVSGVVFVSGDLHMGQVRHLPGQAIEDGRLGPDFWEVTSSPLANTPYNERVVWPESALIAQVPDRCNYGMIQIDLNRKDAEVLLLLKDLHGETLFRQVVPLRTLAHQLQAG